MDIVEIYFGFHPPHRQTIWGLLGHVEAFGYTTDDTWFFFDPTHKRTTLRITHLHDEIEAELAVKFTISDVIMRTSMATQFSAPIHFNMNCVTQCAALVGIRAFTPWGFQRKLLANNAEVIHGRPKGRSSRQERPPERTAPVPIGTPPRR